MLGGGDFSQAFWRKIPGTRWTIGAKVPTIIEVTGADVLVRRTNRPMGRGSGAAMSESSDRALLDLIRRRGPLTVAEMAAQPGRDGHGDPQPADAAAGVGAGRAPGRAKGRGRPRHAYQASVEAQKRLGQNYADLAVVLWEEMMSTVEDRKLRRLLFTRITDRLAEMYRGQVSGQEWEGRLVQLDQPAPRPGGRGRGRPRRRRRVPDPPAALLPLLRAGRGRPRHLRPRAEDVRESAGPRPAAQPVPARRRPLLRLPGQADASRRPGQSVDRRPDQADDRSVS